MFAVNHPDLGFPHWETISLERETGVYLITSFFGIPGARQEGTENWVALRSKEESIRWKLE